MTYTEQSGATPVYAADLEDTFVSGEWDDRRYWNDLGDWSDGRRNPEAPSTATTWSEA